MDLFNSLGSREFIHRRNSENGLTLIERLHSQGFLPLLVRFDGYTQIGHAVSRRRQIVLCQDGFHSGHGKSFAEV